MTNAKEISSILKALGEFYRISLSNGQELIAAAQEKNIWKAIYTFSKSALKSWLTGFRLNRE